MPGSLTALLIAVVVLLPGYVHYAIRQQAFPRRRLSRAMETASLVVVAAGTNTTMLALYGLARLLPPIHQHSPSPSQLLRDPAGYVLVNDSRLAGVVVWAIGLLVGASALSAALASEIWPFKYLRPSLAPSIVKTSGWHQVFHERVPEGATSTFVICELNDGSSFVSGDLVWFNTDPEESPDRHLVLSPPIVIGKGETIESYPLDGDINQLVVSARDIRCIYVSYITDQS